MSEEYDDCFRYIVAVLWCYGDSEARIALTLSKSGWPRATKGVVSGIINRAGDGELRNLGSIEARQAWLDKLRGHRMDKGRLPPRAFKAAPILGGQRR